MTAVMSVPFFSLAPSHAGLDLLGAVRRVMERQVYVLGDEVRQFEQAFAEYCGSAYAIGVANGTEALEIALTALELNPGDEVVMAANAGFYGSVAARSAGAVPVYADVDSGSLTLDPRSLESVISIRTRAILVTHLYGRLADMDDILSVAARHHIPVIEDCAQAHGATDGERMAGCAGIMGCFSFYPTKNLGALGDGGAIICNDPDLAERLRALRQYGWRSKYHVSMAGGRNSRLDEVQAAVLTQKLPFLQRWNEQRRAIASRYDEAFANLPLTLRKAVGSTRDVCHLYVVQATERDRLRAHLRDRGIATDVHYPVPDHRQEIVRAAYVNVTLPVTERACAQVLSLPCYPGMPPDHVGRVIDAVREFFG